MGLFRGNNIGYYLVKVGGRQSDLARAVGVSKQVVYQWVKQICGPDSQKKTKKLLEYLNGLRPKNMPVITVNELINIDFE